MSSGSTWRLPTPGYPEPRRRRRRWPWIVLAIVLVLLALLVVLDRVAVAYAENQAADQMKSQESISGISVTSLAAPVHKKVR
jgi:hypothetical protein